MLLTWRDAILNRKGEDEVVLNWPPIDSLAPEDNDVFAFSGYASPGYDHWMCIYDPATDKFYKKTHVIVEPSQGEFRVSKSAFSKGLSADIHRQQQ